MKIIAVLGSSNENGGSSKLAKEILRGAKEAGHEVKIYKMDDMDVHGCKGCGFCRKNAKDCRLEDDLTAYWKDFHECGALVLTSPNYYAHVTGPMITFMNRHYCLNDKDGNSRVEPGKKLVGVFSQGNGNKEAYKAQYDWYLGTFLKRGMTLAGTIIHTEGEQLDNDCELMKEAYNIGKTL